MTQVYKNPAYWILAVLMITSFSIMVSVSQKESAIMDELAHIPAGYSYVKYLDYRLNPEHPPLIKMLAGLPLLYLNPTFPLESSAWKTDVNGQWEAGTKFLYESGNNADTIIRWARLGPMLVTLVLIFFIYLWSKELMGSWWALLPAGLFALSPTVLAHGHYVTTDLGAALGMFISIYYFTKFLHEQSRKNSLFAGIAFGIAQLLKFSAVILIPYFLLLVLIFYVADLSRDWKPLNRRGKLRSVLTKGLNYTKSTLIIFITSLVVVYPIYFISTLNYPIEKQKADTEFILQSFAGGPTPSGAICKPMRCLAELDIQAASSPLTKPYAQYLLGILMVIQRSSGGNTNYFLGEVSASGWWYYFPLVYLMKEPIPLLILIALASVMTAVSILRAIKKRVPKFLDYLGTNFAEFSMFLFIIIYSAYSIRSTLNIGIRHLLPIMPFLYILTSASLKNWLKNNFFKAQIKFGVIALIILWYVGGTLTSYPHYLSYFNEAISAGNGWQYVTDSNYDWGQDLKKLHEFVQNPPVGEKIDKIAVDYFGGGNLKYYLGSKVEYWWSAKGDPRESNIKWLAVSINTIQGAKGKLHAGQNRNPEDEYQWLSEPYKPYARAGTSIFIYKLTP